MAEIMNKEKAVEILMTMLKNAGFDAEMSRMSELPVLRHTDKDYANITLYPECDASVRQMGGSPSVEELLDAAEQIKSAAMFMKTVNQMELKYRRK